MAVGDLRLRLLFGQHSHIGGRRPFGNHDSVMLTVRSRMQRWCRITRWSAAEHAGSYANVTRRVQFERRPDPGGRVGAFLLGTRDAVELDRLRMLDIRFVFRLGFGPSDRGQSVRYGA